jgi:hypothetical protein
VGYQLRQGHSTQAEAEPLPEPSFVTSAHPLHAIVQPRTALALIPDGSGNTSLILTRSVSTPYLTCHPRRDTFDQKMFAFEDNRRRKGGTICTNSRRDSDCLAATTILLVLELLSCTSNDLLAACRTTWFKPRLIAGVNALGINRFKIWVLFKVNPGK